MAENGRLAFGTSLSNEELKRSGEEAKGVFRDISKTASAEGAKIDSSFRKIGAAIGGYFSARAAADFARQIVNVRKDIESLEVSFKTLLGDEQKAVKLMADIREFAASTPMQMNDLAAGAQTLLGFNIEAEKVMPILKSLGDISMGDSQKFSSLTLAFAQMSSTGKLMGQDLLQMINAGFNPLVQIAEKTGKSMATLKDEMSAGKISVEMVTQAFMDATSEGGKFNGMLEKQSHGINGSLSNLQGAISDMMNEIGEKQNGVIVDSVKILQKLVQNYEAIGKVVGTLVAAYGSYKAAVIAYNAVVAVSTSLTKGYTIAQQIEYVWLLLVEKAQKLLNKTMLSNPYILCATAILTLVAGMIQYSRAAKNARTEQQKLNDMLQEGAERKKELGEKTNELVETVADESKSDMQRSQAYKELQSIYPAYLKNVSQEAFLREKIEGFKKDAPNIIDEDEIRQMKEVQKYLPMLIQYLEYMDSMEKGYSGAGGLKYLNEFNSLKNEMGDAFDESFFYDIVEKFKESGFESAEEYAKAVIQGIKQREQELKEARYEKLTIEQKVAVTENSIAMAKMQIANLKRDVESNPFNMQLKINLKQAEDALAELEKRLERLQKEQDGTSKKTLDDIKKEISKAQAELNKARAAFRKDASEANKNRVANAESSLDNAKKDYKTATGKDYDQAVKAWQDGHKKEKEQRKKNEKEAKEELQEYSKWLVSNAKQTAFDRRQAEIDGMKDGLSKTLAQIELDYNKQISAVSSKEEEMIERLRELKEKEWAAANPTEDKENNPYSLKNSKLSAADLTDDQRKQIEDYGTIALEERRRKEKEALDGSIADIETYRQKRQRILEEYKRREEELYNKGTVTYDESGNITGGTLREGISQGNLDELNRQKDEALNELDNEIASRSATFNNWLNSISGLTVRQLRTMLEAAKKALKQLESDPSADPKKLAEARAIVQKLSDEIKNADLTPTEEALEEWSRYCDAVGEAGEALKNLGDTMEGTAGDIISRLGTMFSYTSKAINGIIDMTQKSMQSVEDVSKATSKALQAASSAVAILAIIQAIYTVVNELKNLLDEYGNTDSGIGKFFSDFLHFLTDSETMLENLALVAAGLGPEGTVLGVLLSKNTNSKRQEHKKLIEDLIDDYDNVGKEVDKLGKQSQKTFGESNAEIQRQQIELKKAQIELLNTAIAEEQAQKKPDEDKINEWQDAIDNLESEIGDLGEAAVDAIFGQDISSAIENFANAMTDAWSQGTDGAVSAKDVVRKQMRMMVQEAIKDAIEAGGAMARIREKLAEFFDDGVFTPEEQAEIEQMAEDLQRQIDEQFGWATRLFEDSDREGSRKGIATASQESVDELNGRMTAVQGHTFSINENTMIIRDNVTAILGVVMRIERNTEALSTIMRTINDIQTQGVRIRR